MKSLFTIVAFEEIHNRLERLNKHSKARWEIMENAQMLAYCCKALKIPLEINTSVKEPFLKKILFLAYSNTNYTMIPNGGKTYRLRIPLKL